MGWKISNGRASMQRSYSHMDTLGGHLAHALSARDWRKVRHLFGRTGDPFTVTAKEAGNIAAVLTRASQSPQTTPDWARDISDLADSARTAATSGRSWSWS